MPDIPTQTTSPSQVIGHDFLVEEYKCLSGEIHYRFKEIAELERYTVIALAAFYTWAFSSTSPRPLYIWLVPVALSVAGAIRTAFYMYVVDQISIYMEGTERRLGVYPAWEGSLQKRRHKRGWVHLAFSLGGTSAVFWVCAVLLTAAITAFNDVLPVK